ncbi:MAG: hypothetical protein ABIU11_04450 [Chitinophagaceae bacterium]
MTWNSVMGIISTVALFLPIIFILIFRLGAYRTFPVLLGYYVIAFINNFLGEQYINTSNQVIKYCGLANNLLDAPVILLFLIYFCTSALQARRMRLLIFSFILFEITVVLLMGFSKQAITIILAPGLLLVVGFCLIFFIRQAKMAIVHGKATGKAFISASLLFAYGCYFIIYLMYYIFESHLSTDKIIQQEYIDDTFLVYFFVATISSLLLCAGIFIESKRVQKLNELKITRKELSAIYDGTETAVRLRTAILDFDRDQYN